MARAIRRVKLVTAARLLDKRPDACQNEAVGGYRQSRGDLSWEVNLMQVLERLGWLGALMTAVIVPLLLYVRRNAKEKAQRDEAQREEEMRLCASHLHLLGAALHAYQQDHQNELPHKFICPPHDRILNSEWGREWNKTSLADYIIDADAYGCPCEGERGKRYGYRIPWLLRDGPRQLMRPAPESVVMFCDSHANWHSPKRDWSGEFVVLRMRGAVERVPASEADIWQYWEGQWHSPDETPIEGANIWLVFPGEPWPPDLETVTVKPLPAWAA